MKTRNKIIFLLNGEIHEVGEDFSLMMLGDYLRYQKQLTGTKIVCAEGDCGACTVLRCYPDKKKNLFHTVNSCIATVAQMDCSSVVTVDSLDDNQKINEAQEKLISCHGTQCGFCTPGFIMSMTGLLEKKIASNKKTITEQEAKNALTGNLCRCTGYESIIKATTNLNVKNYNVLAKRFLTVKNKKFLLNLQTIPVQMNNLIAPIKIKSALENLKYNKSFRLLSGGTDLGVQVNKGRTEYKEIMSLHLINELYEIKKIKNTIQIGARVTFHDLRKYCEKNIPEFSKFLDVFASPQIKNMATVVGNVANASPIGDSLPFLYATNTVVYIEGLKGRRQVLIDKFIKGYRSVDLKVGELITHLQFEIPKKDEIFKMYKTATRKDLDISAINGAFRIKVNKKNNKIDDVIVALGGVGPSPIRLKMLEKKIKGKVVQDLDIISMIQTIQNDISPISDLRGSSSYRRVLVDHIATSFFKPIIDGGMNI